MHVGLQTDPTRTYTTRTTDPLLFLPNCWEAVAVKAVLVWEVLPQSELLCCISSPLTLWEKTLCLLSRLNRGQSHTARHSGARYDCAQRILVFGIRFCSRMHFVMSKFRQECCRLIKLRAHISWPSDLEPSIGFKNCIFHFCCVMQTPLKRFDWIVL